LTYRLLAGAEADIDRVLLQSAREFGIEAAERYDLLMRSVFAAVEACPAGLVLRTPAITGWSSS
jgi:hypothetical protein